MYVRTLVLLFALGCLVAGCSSAPPEQGSALTAPAAQPTSTTRPDQDTSPASASEGSEETNTPTPEQGRCQKDRGCPEPRAIPTCAKGIVATTIAVLDTNAKRLNGKEVSVKGPLGLGGSCTERGCDAACCNSCGGPVILGERYSPHQEVSLVAPDDPERFRCSGDETLTCCPFKAQDKVVVATGTFRFRTEREVEVVSWTPDNPKPQVVKTYKEPTHELILEDPVLCVLP